MFPILINHAGVEDLLQVQWAPEMFFIVTFGLCFMSFFTLLCFCHCFKVPIRAIIYQTFENNIVILVFCTLAINNINSISTFEILLVLDFSVFTHKENSPTFN